jgi:hypothetical protein
MVDVIGEMEMLNSLANFGITIQILFIQIYSIIKLILGLSSLLNKTRIGNDVWFYPQSFMILTDLICLAKVL